MATRRIFAPVLALLAAMIALLPSAVSPARAQAEASGWPKQPIRLLIGFAAGGGNDLFGRLVAQKLSEKLGVPVVVENKPGAGSIIAYEQTARAAPDGYTLAVTPFGASIVNPAVYAKLPYDPIKGLTPISIVASFPFILTVSTALPIKSVPDLVAYAKAHPDQANYGTPSVTFQLLVEQFKMKTGTAFEHIPFKSTAEVLTGLLNGQLMMSFVDPGPLIGHLKSGRVIALAVAAPKRFPPLPDVPTLAELGIQGVEMDSFMGISGPGGLPQPIVARLEAELLGLIKQPDVQEKLAIMGLVPAGVPASEFAARIAREIPMWKAVAETAKIKLE